MSARHWSEPAPKKPACHYCGGQRAVEFVLKRRKDGAWGYLYGVTTAEHREIATCPLCAS